MIQKVKLIILVTFVFISTNANSQVSAPKYSTEKNIQFYMLPGVFYNSGAVALGFKNEKIEHTVELYSNYKVFLSRWFMLGVFYNRNFYLKNDRTFIPIWGGINRMNVNNNYEDGGPYYDRMFIMAGTGIGRNFVFKNSHKLRFEVGIAASLYMENRSSYDNESPFPFRPALNKFTLVEGQPVIPWPQFKMRYVIPYKKK